MPNNIVPVHSSPETRYSGEAIPNSILVRANQHVMPVYNLGKDGQVCFEIDPKASTDDVAAIFASCGIQLNGIVDEMIFPSGTDKPQLFAYDSCPVIGSDIYRLSPWERGLDDNIEPVNISPDQSFVVMKVTAETTGYQLGLAVQRFLGIGDPKIIIDIADEPTGESVYYLATPSEDNHQVVHLTKIDV